LVLGYIKGLAHGMNWVCDNVKPAN